MSESNCDRQATLNDYGVQFPLFAAAQLAIEYVKSYDVEQTLELGCAFGNLTLELLSYTNVTANDLDERHLDIVNSHYVDRKHQLTLAAGKLQDLTFKDNTFDLIVALNVFCFLKPNEIEKTLKKLYDWLKSGGLFLSHHGTPFGKRPEPFLPIYKDKVSQGEPFPGYLDNTKHYMPHNKKGSAKLPSYFHLLDKTVLTRESQKVGFKVMKMDYINNADHLPELTHLTSHGKEWLMAMLRKV